MGLLNGASVGLSVGTGTGGSSLDIGVGVFAG